MIKKLIGVLLFAATLIAQTGGANVPMYTASKTTVLAGAAEVITLRVPASVNRAAYLIDAFLYCSVACTVTLEKNGTWSAGTQLGSVPGRTTNGNSVLSATYGTTISSTATIVTYTLAAGEKLSLDMRGIFLTDLADAITLRTSSITGTATLSFKWEERN